MAISELEVTSNLDKPVYLYKLTNEQGTTVKITNIGATVTSIETPDKNGDVKEITLGFDNPIDYLSASYLSNCPFFGATIGRYANRIAGGKFHLNDKEYTLAKNNGDNHLHGGPTGFSTRIWNSSIKNERGIDKLVMTLESPDMDEGYPGNVFIKVVFTLTNSHELIIDYSATTDQATPLNLTNHTYFNLSGEKSSIMNHELLIFADAYTPVVNGIPTGELKAVKGTPFDFTQLYPIGKRLNQLDEEAYDHNYVLNDKEGELRRVAFVKENDSGRTLEVFTTMPGMQLYTGYYLDGSHKNNGRKFERFEGFCLETQYFPDSPNQLHFPSAISSPSQPFEHTTVYKFGVK